MQCLYRRSPLPIAIRLRPIPPDSTLFPYTTLFRSKFNEALMTGDLEALVDVLAPDVVYMADGGGVRTAARHPVVGAEVVHKLLQGAVRIAGGEFATAVAPVNGSAGLLVHLRGTLDR